MSKLTTFDVKSFVLWSFVMEFLIANSTTLPQQRLPYPSYDMFLNAWHRDKDKVLCRASDWQLKGSVKEPNMFHNYETEKITRKASDVVENLQLYRVVRFFCTRSSCTTHLMLFSEHPPIYSSCMTISGGRTEQDVIIGSAVD